MWSEVSAGKFSFYLDGERRAVGIVNFTWCVCVDQRLVRSIESLTQTRVSLTRYKVHCNGRQEQDTAVRLGTTEGTPGCCEILFFSLCGGERKKWNTVMENKKPDPSKKKLVLR